MSDNDSLWFFIGFSVTDDSLLDGATDMVGFLKEAGDSLIYAVNTKNSVGDTTSMGITLTDVLDNTFLDLAISFSDSSQFVFEIRRGTTFVRVSHTTAARMLTDTELTPTIELLYGNATAEAFGSIMRVDWFFCMMARY